MDLPCNKPRYINLLNLPMLPVAHIVRNMRQITVDEHEPSNIILPDMRWHGPSRSVALLVIKSLIVRNHNCYPLSHVTMVDELSPDTLDFDEFIAIYVRAT